MDEENDSLKKLERLKIREELKQLRTQNKQSRTKLILSILGVAIVIIGLFIDRISTLEQRKFEFEKLQVEKKVNRMVEVAATYDQLFSSTITILAKHETRTWQLATHIYALNMALKKIEPGDAEGCANTYSLDAVFMTPDQPSYHGRQAIKERYDKMFKSRNDSVIIEMNETVHDVIYFNDWAVMRGSGYETRRGAETKETYKWIILAKRQPSGKWETVWDIFNDVESI